MFIFFLCSLWMDDFVIFLYNVSLIFLDLVFFLLEYINIYVCVPPMRP
jgi:hypothetical protein